MISILIAVFMYFNKQQNIKNNDLLDACSKYASNPKNNEILIYHLKKGADVNCRDSKHQRTPLIYLALQSDNLSSLEYLLKKGADINASDKTGITALYGAVFMSKAKKNKIKFVELLLDYGAEKYINRLYPDGTVLDVAICLKDKEIANLLREHGAKTAKELKAEKTILKPSTNN